MTRQYHFLILLLMALPVFAADRLVPDDYATIQSAIDAAENGDVVLLAAGTYNGEGNRDLDTQGKAITLRGTAPNTIIDCQGSEAAPHRGFSFTNGETTETVIDGLTIRNGWATTSGGAVSCTNGSSPSFQGCIFENNTANFYGGAIYCLNEAKPTLNDCEFKNNITVPTSDGRAGLDGGAIYCMTNSDAVMTHCRFDNNSGKSGGAIYSNSSSPTITGCSFTNNYASSKGGAVALWISHATIHTCLFATNSANYVGGGLLVEKDCRASITNCTISQNSTVFYEGGGIAFNGADNPTINNSIIWNNLPDEIKVFSGVATVSYCDVKGSWEGTGNLNIDPMFADATNGDFHLKSSAGRWEAVSETWVNDGETSPCVDAGDEESSYADEPSPSGERINLGTYGNTTEASKSPGRVTLTTVVDGGNGTISPGGDYLTGTEVTLQATPSTGYRVLTWSGTDIDPNEGSETNLVTMSEDKTVTVTFEKAPAPTFTLAASVVGTGGTISPQNGTFDLNSEVTLTATPDYGYRVKGWMGTDDDESTANTNTVTITENTTVTVEFEVTMYTLTTKVDGEHGTLKLTDEREFPADTIVSLTATADEGYRVKKWTGTDNDSSVDVINTARMNADKTVTISFEPKPYTLDTSVEGGYGTLTANPAGPTVNYDTAVTFTAVPDQGYRVKAWTGTDNDPAAGSTTNSVVIKGDTTVKVKFEAVPEVSYALTTETVNSYGTIEPSAGVYGENDTVTLTAKPDTGYRVKAWTGTDDDTSTAETNTVTMTKDQHVTVEFERVYSLTASVDGDHGSVEPTSGIYLPGETVTLTATPDNGYRVKTWLGEGIEPQAGSNSISFPIERDMDVTVAFEAIPVETCTLTTTIIGDHGSVDPNSGTFDQNKTVSLTATPDEKYRVKEWKGTDNDSSTATTNSVTLTTDKSVSVEFEKIQYQLTIVKSGPGTLDGEGLYDIDSVAILNAIPDAGCRIKSWSGTDDDESTATTNTATMTQDTTVIVTFEPITYKLTLEAVNDDEGQTHGSVTSNPAASTFDAETLVELIATPDTGYRVKTWTGTDDNPATGNNTNRVVMTDNKNVTVEFEAIPTQIFTLTTEVPSSHGKVIPSTGIYEPGTPVTLTAVPDDGYRISSWNGEPSSSETHCVTMDSDQLVLVRFQEIVCRYSLTASVISGNGSVSPTSNTYNDDTVVTLTAVPAEGYRVKEWTGTDLVPFTGSNENHVTMTADKNVTVEFEPIPTQTFATLRVNVVGNGSVSPKSGKYYTGSDAKLLATPEPGYHIKSWSGTNNDESTDITNTVTLDTDKTVTVTFEKDIIKLYTLTVTISTGHGTVSPNGGECVAGTTVQFTARPESGYRIKSWSGTDNDPNVGGTTNQVTMSSDKTITVEFELIPDPASVIPPNAADEEAPNPTDTDTSNPTNPTNETRSNSVDEEPPDDESQEIIDQAGSLCCGAGAMIFLPLCWFFALLIKWNFAAGRA